MSSWVDKESVIVSVVCATFNQELYIEDAITGFLMQETYFAFEIIIHDDASTDNTANIVRKYQKRYPKIIKPIFQKENQFSKGGFKPTPYATSFAKGEFIALCEGDDFWVDASKINSQLVYLQKNSNVDLCIHDATIINGNGDFLPKSFHSHSTKPALIDYSLMYTQNGQLAATASYFFRKSSLNKAIPILKNAPVGDFFIEAIVGLNGIFYIPDKMSVYRYEALGSWTEKTFLVADKRLIHNYKMLESLDELINILPRKEAELVKFKKHFIHVGNMNMYIVKNEILNSIKSYLRSLKGSESVKSNLINFLIVVRLYRFFRIIKKSLSKF